MRRALAVALLLAVLGIASNQALSRNDVYGLVGTEFTWASSAPAWSGDHTLVTKSDFSTQVKNNGNCAPGASSNYVMVYSDMQACAVNTVPVPHSPILANNTFSGGSFASWTADTVGGTCTTGTNFAGNSGTDEDSDSGFTSATSICFTSGATYGMFGFNQTFNIGGTPTSQSYSFWYQAPYILTGDPVNCDQNNGFVTNITLKVNGTTVRTISLPTQDTSWHQVTGTTSLLVSGSNTLDLSVQLSGAKGSTLRFIGGHYICQTTTASQPFYVDNFSLTATY